MVVLQEERGCYSNAASMWTQVDGTSKWLKKLKVDGNEEKNRKHNKSQVSTCNKLRH